MEARQQELTRQKILTNYPISKKKNLIVFSKQFNEELRIIELNRLAIVLDRFASFL